MIASKIFKSIFFILIITTILETEALTKPLSQWKTLHKGNNNFANTKKKLRKKLACGQNPCTIVLSCSDSRVPPELIFKQSLGKLFVVRVAGEVADDVVVDSIEYAVTHFDSVLIIVLGHTQCGAVEGAVNRLIENNGQILPTPGHIDAVLRPIEMAILAAAIDIYAPNAVELSVRANILYVANTLINESHDIQEAIANGTIDIMGAEYDLRSGKVLPLFILSNEN